MCIHACISCCSSQILILSVILINRSECMNREVSNFYKTFSSNQGKKLVTEFKNNVPWGLQATSTKSF